MKKKKPNRLLRFIKYIYRKLFRTHDTPQKIALGFGLGVFLGILPGAGPIASLIVASLLRANRAAAFLGCLITNTWLSIATIILSIKVGSVIMGLEWQDVYRDWQLVIRDFHWRYLFKLSVLKLLLPILAGYLVIAVVLGLFAYAIALLIAIQRKHRKGIT